MAQKKEIKLKVVEAIQDDVNKGIVRIDSTIMKEVDARPGDIVELEGERKTVAVVDRAYPGDIGLNIIRMDGLTRRNAKTSIGEQVKISKSEVKEAGKVIIAPATKGVMIKASPYVFKRGLLGRAVLKGDIVSIGGSQKRRSAMSGSPFDEIFSMLEDMDVSAGAGFGFADIKFVIAETTPKAPVIITDETQIVFNPEAVEIKEEAGVPEVAYEDIGGLDEEIRKIREMVEIPLKHPEIFQKLGIEPPKGVLLHGPPGTGKTLMAKAVANETGSHFIVINGPEIMSKFYGQSEENLRKIFEEAEKSAPSIVFIDEIDAIATKREETKGEVERRVVAQLLALMDGLKSRGKVVVIAATNVPNILDPALRRPGRFDRELEIGVPGKEGRLNILKIHTRNMALYREERALNEMKDVPEKYKKAVYELLKSNAKGKTVEERISRYLQQSPEKTELFDKIDSKKIKEYLDKLKRDPKIVNLNELSNITYGFVGADLSALAREAAMVVLRRVLPDLRFAKKTENESLPEEILEKLYVTQEDFREALRVVRPSALREVLVEVPNVKWTSIGGLEEVKQELKEAVEWPLKNPQAFSRMGVKPPKGILLYGAPGTGKTLLAKAIATESEANFILVKGPELLSKWVGESEKAVREVFKKARQTAPTIICFDEIDSMAPRRGMQTGSHVTETVVNQLLTEMDGLEELNEVVVIATTNRPDMIDTALLRPGRFDRIILAPVPDLKTREEIFRLHTKGMPLKNVKVEELAAKTEGYVGADIEAVCREAAMLALRKDIKASVVTMKDFEAALGVVRPSATKDIEKEYKDLKDQFTAARAKEMREDKPAYFG
ncbi:CDC48 family AAA ATPase [Candidatus Woesearchaeota archaeon]|nr:CDC48 family AAA ATPase [Candidatus Woesearchaeota archaeon]